MQAVGPKNFRFGCEHSGSQGEKERVIYRVLSKRRISIPQSKTFLGSKFYSKFFL